jgi:hypothetical protein
LFRLRFSSVVYFREVGGLEIQAVIMWHGCSVVLSILVGSEVGGLRFVYDGIFTDLHIFAQTIVQPLCHVVQFLGLVT